MYKKYNKPHKLTPLEIAKKNKKPIKQTNIKNDSDSEDIDDDLNEDIEDYKVGGYHPVNIDEIYNNKYIVKQKLGWGHFSTVWLVNYEGNKKGALKIVKSAKHYTETAEDEVEIMKTITKNDPEDKYNCLKLIDSFYHNGPNGRHVCMVMTVAGSNLLDLIKLYKYKGLSTRVTKSITKQVLIALDFLHTKCNLIHTDLKPENVLLNFRIDLKNEHMLEEIPQHPDDFIVKLADFGNCNWTFKHYTNDIQTRQYRAPEVILGCQWSTPVDIWSMACMSFELLTGDYLFQPNKSSHWSKEDDHLALFMELLGDIPKSMISESKYGFDFFNRNYQLKRIPSSELSYWPLNEVLMEKYSFKPDYADVISDLFVKMLIYDPNKRITAADALKHRWFFEQ